MLYLILKFLLIFCIGFFILNLIKNINKFNIHKAHKALISIGGIYVMIFCLWYYIYHNIEIFLLIFFIFFLFDNRITIIKKIILIIIAIILFFCSIYIEQKPLIILVDIYWLIILLNLAVIWHGFILKWLFDFCLYIKNDYWIYTVSRISMLTSLSGIMIYIYIIKFYISYIFKFWERFVELELLSFKNDNNVNKGIFLLINLLVGIVNEMLSIFNYVILGIIYGILYNFMIVFFFYWNWILSKNDKSIYQKVCIGWYSISIIIILLLVFGWYYEIVMWNILWWIILGPKICKSMIKVIGILWKVEDFIDESIEDRQLEYIDIIQKIFFDCFADLLSYQYKKIDCDWRTICRFMETKSCCLWYEQYNLEIFREFSPILFKHETSFDFTQGSKDLRFNPNYIWDFYIFRPEQERRLIFAFTDCFYDSYDNIKVYVWISDCWLKSYGIEMSVSEFLDYYKNKYNSYLINKKTKYKVAYVSYLAPGFDNCVIGMSSEEFLAYCKNKENNYWYNNHILRFQAILNSTCNLSDYCRELEYEWNNEYSIIDYLSLEEGYWDIDSDATYKSTTKEIVKKFYNKLYDR